MKKLENLLKVGILCGLILTFTGIAIDNKYITYAGGVSGGVSAGIVYGLYLHSNYKGPKKED